MVLLSSHVGMQTIFLTSKCSSQPFMAAQGNHSSIAVYLPSSSLYHASDHYLKYTTTGLHNTSEKTQKTNVYQDLSAHWHMNKQTSVYLTKCRWLALKLCVQCFKRFQRGTWHVINIQSNASVLHYTDSTHLNKSFYCFIYIFRTDRADRAGLLCTEFLVSYLFSAPGAIYSSLTGKLHKEMMPQTFHSKDVIYS